MGMTKTKTEQFNVKFPPDEGELVRKTARELDVTPAELIRLCVSTELARKSGDPAALDALARMFREGVHEWIRTRVDYEIAKEKSGKKRA